MTMANANTNASNVITYPECEDMEQLFTNMLNEMVSENHNDNDRNNVLSNINNCCSDPENVIDNYCIECGCEITHCTVSTPLPSISITPSPRPPTNSSSKTSASASASSTSSTPSLFKPPSMSAKDPARVQVRRTSYKHDPGTIFHDLESMGFSDSIVKTANELFQEISECALLRGNCRRAVVFACVFHAFKINSKSQSHERLMLMFNLSRKAGLRGLKHVNLYAPKSSVIHSIYITPKVLITELMDKFMASDEQKNAVVNIFNLIKNRSSVLNRARPQSVSAGIVFYWIHKTGKTISSRDFAKKADISELTIMKIAKEVSCICNDILRSTHNTPNDNINILLEHFKALTH